MKAMAADGLGFIAVPTVTLREAVLRHGFRSLGQAPRCQVSFYGITAERRISHPVAALITRHTLA